VNLEIPLKCFPSAAVLSPLFWGYSWLISTFLFELGILAPSKECLHFYQALTHSLPRHFHN
jgi:hypothetical protein